MNIIQRIMNAYKTKGIIEIVRKTWFYFVYKIHNFFTYIDVKNRREDYGLNTAENRKEKVIVSLTSYPPRFKYIGLTLKSLTQQSYKPDKIIVYLGNDARETDLTEEMKSFISRGVEYRFDSTRNLRSHKKYFYAVQEFPDDVVVTADDDIVYPHNWLESLINSYKRYPNAVSARRVHKIRLDKNGNLLPYNHWIDQYRKLKTPSHALIATGNSGVLYPPHIFDERLFNEQNIKQYCFEADDIWLKCMEILCDIPVVWVPNNEVSLKDVDNSITLSADNVGNGKNDLFLNQVIMLYNIKNEDFLK